MIFRKRPPQPPPAPSALDALRQLVRDHLPDADDDARAVVVAIAGLLAGVAYADREYHPSEDAHAREALGHVHGLSPAGVVTICDALRTHARELASNPQQHTRVLRELGDVELRRDVLDALVDLAASDDELTMAETDLLRRTAAAMGLTPDDYLRAQARHRERLSVLK